MKHFLSQKGHTEQAGWGPTAAMWTPVVQNQAGFVLPALKRR